jgi:hypothetical protein
MKRTPRKFSAKFIAIVVIEALNEGQCMSD